MATASATGTTIHSTKSRVRCCQVGLGTCVRPEDAPVGGMGMDQKALTTSSNPVTPAARLIA